MGRNESHHPDFETVGPKLVNMNIPETIRVVQNTLGLEADGKAGPQTWEAIYTRIVPAAQQPSAESPLTSKVSDRSEKVIATLLPEVQPYARSLITQTGAAGIHIEVISGLRTYAGKIVTNARGGYSNHNFGIAFDIGIFDGTKYIEESPQYKAAGTIGVSLGLDWGGNWKTIEDQPHFELRPSWAADRSESDMLAQLRSRKDSGQAVYA